MRYCRFQCIECGHLYSFGGIAVFHNYAWTDTQKATDVYPDAFCGFLFFGVLTLGESVFSDIEAVYVRCFLVHDLFIQSELQHKQRIEADYGVGDRDGASWPYQFRVQHDDGNQYAFGSEL